MDGLTGAVMFALSDGFLHVGDLGGCLRLGCAEPVDGRWLGVDCHSDSVGCLFRHGAQPALLACVHVAIDMSC